VVDDEDGSFYRAFVFDELEDYETLIERLADTSTAAGLCNRGLARAEIGEPDAAFADFAAAIAVDPAADVPYMNRGDLFRHLGKLADAVIDYGAAIERVPTDPYYRRSRAMVLHLLGRHAEAIVDYDVSIQVDPAFARGRENRARAAAGLPPLD